MKTQKEENASLTGEKTAAVQPIPLEVALTWWHETPISPSKDEQRTKGLHPSRRQLEK